MTAQRRIPALGQPSKGAPAPRREPQLPSQLLPVPARGPSLTLPAARNRTA